MVFLIFGGTGFVGSNLGKHLKNQGHKVISTSRSGRPGTIKLDITNTETFSQIEIKPDVIVNCASVVPAKDRKTNDPDFLNDLFVTNVLGGANISNWAVKRGVKKIINCSTLVVVKKPWPTPMTERYFALPEGPHTGYSMSKLSQEQIMSECCRNSGTDIIHLRLSAVYGTGMVSEGVIFDLWEAASQDRNLVLKNAWKNFIDLIHVDDVSKGIERIASKNFLRGATIMNLASGTELSILKLAESISEIIDSSSKISNEEQEKEVSRADIKVEKFMKFIGQEDFSFLPVEKGLEEVIEYYNSKKEIK